MPSTAMEPSLDAIRREMGSQRMSQRELARRLGWDPVRTHRRIAGDVELTVGELREIAAALDVPVHQLLPATEPTQGSAR